MTGFLTLVFYVATFGTLTYLSVRELRGWWLRRTHADRVVVVDVLPPRPSFPRCLPDKPRRVDPSPSPRDAA